MAKITAQDGAILKKKLFATKRKLGPLAEKKKWERLLNTLTDTAKKSVGIKVSPMFYRDYCGHVALERFLMVEEEELVKTAEFVLLKKSSGCDTEHQQIVDRGRLVDGFRELIAETQDPTPRQSPKPVAPTVALLVASATKEVRRLKAAGFSISAISKATNFSPHYVRKFLTITSDPGTDQLNKRVLGPPADRRN